VRRRSENKNVSGLEGAYASECFRPEASGDR